MISKKVFCIVVVAQTFLLVFSTAEQANAQMQSIVKHATPPVDRIARRLVIQDPVLLENSQVVEPTISEQFQLAEPSVGSVEPNVLPSQEFQLLELRTRAPVRQEFGPWPRKGIREIAVDIRETSNEVPEDRSVQLLRSGSSEWSSFAAAPKVFAWVAPDIRYQPLYFEDVALERYGQTKAPYIQSTLSAAHFFKSFVLLPHQMRHDAPGSCDSPLGFCRPGNVVPTTKQRTYHGRPRR